MKTCPCPCGCKESANTLEEIERVFGWRGRITQSYCRKCRVPHKGIQNAENINPIFDIILEGVKRDYQFNNYYLSKLPRYNESGKRLTYDMKNKLTKEYVLTKNNNFVEIFLKLIVESEPNIEEEQFLKLFEIYNFYTKKPEKESFFNFIISESKEINLNQELNSKKQIFIIIKTYQEISETYIKILSTKLKNSSAIIINFVTYMDQDFIKNNNRICVLNRDMIISLLKYRNDEIELSDIYHLEKNTDESHDENFT